ncbi:MAG: phospholipase [Maritimibacter sp.]|nr:phospholipase [Maritimibacter sp.]
MVKVLKVLGGLIAVFALAVVALRVMYPLPDLPETGELPDPTETELTRLVGAQTAAHPDVSGIVALESGLDAFAARVVLTRSATASIDAQYYIWHDDLTGLRLLAELQEAAKRGVTVRLLVDDNGTPTLDPELSALDALPTAEVRIFNPFTFRTWRPLNYAFDFFRLNRRMHNKSMTFDRRATIVGGRNVGDIYFAKGDNQYIDLDVLAIGPAADAVTEDFSRYWASGSSYAIADLVTFQDDWADRLERRDAENRTSEEGQEYAEAVQGAALLDNLRNQTVPFEWVPAQLFSDDPAKGLGEAAETPMMRTLLEAIGEPEISFDIMSAYFIAGPSATDRLVSFAENGVAVRVLTNSLEATDVVPVHSGYIEDRVPLLRGGVDLFELRSAAEGERSLSEFGLSDLSDAALHAKSFAVDRQRAFIGSMNFDPRSRRLNTEMGFLIDSPALAERISGWLDDNLSGLTYQVSETEDGSLQWSETNASGEVTTWDTEPNTTVPLRIAVRVISWLPIEWLL